MHFTIPNFEKCIDEKDDTFTVYNIFINGAFHCRLRYTQLLDLHSKIKIIFSKPLSPFPPKKIFPLTFNQTEHRRQALERYLQFVGQTKFLTSSETVQIFFLESQVLSFNGIQPKTNINVFLLNGQCLKVAGAIMDNSEIILKKVCDQLGLPLKFIEYFSLYLADQQENDFIVYRQLFNFESPYLSKLSSKNLEIFLRKSYFDLKKDEILMGNEIALDILYMQSLVEGKHDQYLIHRQEEFEKLKMQNRRKEFLELARKSRMYGCLIYRNVETDFPENNTRATIIFLSKQIILQLWDNGEKIEFEFNITRIKCWRLTSYDDNYEFSFEYLLKKDKLQWIRVISEYSVMLSICLQNVIDELWDHRKNIKKISCSGNTSHLPQSVYFNRYTETIHNTTFSSITDSDL